MTNTAVARRALVMAQVIESPGLSVIDPPTVVGNTVVDPLVALVQAIVAV
jgi:hypothetical protein